MTKQILTGMGKYINYWNDNSKQKVEESRGSFLEKRVTE
jgi:hypothetical protein